MDIQNLISATEIISAFVSIILTAALVRLYQQQTDIQKTQSEMMNSQTEVMKNNQRPLIDICEFSLDTSDASSTILKSPLDEPEAIQIGIKNVGRGVAIDPRIYTSLDFDHDSLNPVKESFRPERHLIENSSTELEFENLSSSIAPQEELSFEAIVHFCCFDEDKQGYFCQRCGTILSLLYARGVKEIEIELGITVDSLAGSTEEFNLLNLEVDLKEFLEFAFPDSSDTNMSSNMFFFRNLSIYYLFDTGGRLLELNSYPDLEENPWPAKTEYLRTRFLEESIESPFQPSGKWHEDIRDLFVYQEGVIAGNSVGKSSETQN
jgi:hypothetical protein